MNNDFIIELRKLYKKSDSVEEVAEKINSTNDYCNDFPIPIVQIMKDLDFVITKQDMSNNIKGYIAINNETINTLFKCKKLICVNKDEEFGNQRFTIAHEFAHFLFDFSGKNGEEFYNTYNSDEKETTQEKRANKFAANLLMPKNKFIEKYKEWINGNDCILKLMQFFGVSEKAVIKRIGELQID